MTSGNSTGAGAQNLEAFDKLPPSARMALANALFDWAPGGIFRAWNRGATGFKTGPQIAAAVRMWDVNLHAKDVKQGKVAP